MNVRKEILLDQVPGLYAVGSILLDGELYYGAASENRGGKVFLVHSVTKEVSELFGGAGGVMAILEASGEKAIFCIEEFYPVFDSASAKIVKVTLERSENGWFAAEREVVAELPYVHRIAQIKVEDGTFIAAGKLCENKKFSDDWSQAGSMEIGRYIPETGVCGISQVQSGLCKHHAMFVRKNAAGCDELYYGGSEGAFCTVRKGGSWETKKLLSAPVSDLVCLDLDEDGKDEIAIIEGFHGNKLVIFKEKYTGGGTAGYEAALELPLDFGHVLWGSTFSNGPALIAGSRGGEKELILYRFGFTGERGLYVKAADVIDKGQAPAQIIVRQTAQGIEVTAANHGAAQLVRYVICP